MMLWAQWWTWCAPLCAACKRRRTALWMCATLMAFCVREDLAGVTSFVRALGLTPECYDRLLDFFHSEALDLGRLTRLWARLVVQRHPSPLRFNNRLVLVADGLKTPKAGKKMPGVKRLHQSSDSNTKPEYILGHSCQAVGLLVRGLSSVAAIPLAARIHEGIVHTNRDKRTLLDKLLELIDALAIDSPCYLVADAFYASQKVALPLLKRNNHLVTRVRHNSVGYELAPPPAPGKRGRPRLYGERVPIKGLFGHADSSKRIDSPVYGETGVTLNVWTRDLLWRPLGMLVRFVAVEHPTRGRFLLMTTDLNLQARDVIEIYGYRFKIEVSFKSALRVVGAFGYQFWMRNMTPITRKAGNQHLHRKPKKYRDEVMRKLRAYHRYIQLGLIAQGIMVALATTAPELVWKYFGSWIRTKRINRIPSEAVVSTALRNTLPAFLADTSNTPDLTKFLQQRLDMEITQGKRLAA